MKLKYQLAKTLRRNLTPAEFILWEGLRHREPGGPIFRRQYPFGPYILDFYCVKAKLAVEVDGLTHDHEIQASKDERRDAWLKAQGVEVYRVPAHEVFHNLGETEEGIQLLALERMARIGKDPTTI